MHEMKCLHLPAQWGHGWKHRSLRNLSRDGGMSSKGYRILGESQAAKSGVELEIQIEQSARLRARRNHENFRLTPVLKEVEANLERRRTDRRADCAQRRGLRVRHLAGESESQVIIFPPHPPRIRRQGQRFGRERKPVANVRFR